MDIVLPVRLAEWPRRAAVHYQTAWAKTGKVPVRVVQTATGRGFAVSQVVAEIGSGMNGHRRKLTRLLSDPAAIVIVVEHRDRLTRFGFEHLAASLAAAGRRIVVLDESETTDDLVRDLTEVLTSRLCARLCGRRWASRRAANAVAVATSAEQA